MLEKNQGLFKRKKKKEFLTISLYIQQPAQGDPRTTQLRNSKSISAKMFQVPVMGAVSSHSTAGVGWKQGYKTSTLT